ncbi:MAG: hypothetical protein PHF57_05715 [Methanoregula sp.]|jgi:hypothetical protein|nr:hypothetical protein [Methanoregula sp.]
MFQTAIIESEQLPVCKRRWRMKKVREMMMSRTALICFTIVIAVVVIAIVLLTSSPIQSNEKEEMEHMRYPLLPKSVNADLSRLNKEKPFVVNRWEIDENQKKIVLYVIWMNARQINELQNKQVGDWYVTAVPDTEMIKEMETVRAEMHQLEQDPEMQLATYTMGVGNGHIDLYVYLFNYTPKNRELLKNGIRGWKVDGGAVTTPSWTPTGTMR